MTITVELASNEYVFEALIVAGILPENTPGSFCPVVSMKDIAEAMNHLDKMDGVQKSSLKFLFNTPLFALAC